jgi:hypothetical protein
MRAASARGNLWITRVLAFSFSLLLVCHAGAASEPGWLLTLDLFTVAALSWSVATGKAW